MAPRHASDTGSEQFYVRRHVLHPCTTEGIFAQISGVVGGFRFGVDVVQFEKKSGSNVCCAEEEEKNEKKSGRLQVVEL